MATAVSDGFFNFSQSFFSTDVLQKISREIDQPIEQTKSGLKSVLPALLMGVVKKASEREGAQEVIDMAKKQFDQNQGNRNKVSMSGSEYLHGIFGDNLNSVITKLSNTTGMNSYSVTKMMGVSAPLILGALGSKIKSENMNATSLMNYLSSQKSSLVALLPKSLSSILSNPKIQKINAYSTSNSTFTTGVGFNWGRITLVTLVILFFMWIFSSLFNSNKMRVVPLEDPSATNRIVSTNQVIEASGLNLMGVSAIGEFLRGTNATGQWKRFKFDDLIFIKGTTAPLFDEMPELDQIAEAMAIHPNTVARIESYTDNVGSAAFNEELSLERAMMIKVELMNRGISPRRIEAIGFGASNPIASNETDEGRAQNSRIELVLRH